MLFILIPIHNNIEESLKCLDCIKEQTYTDYEVIVINDGSTDGSSEIIKEKYPQTTIIEGDGNMWWAGALYAGIEYVLERAYSSDYILMLNNDLVFNKYYFDTLVKAGDINPDTAIGSLCRDQKTGDIVDSGVFIDWKRLAFTHKEVLNNDDFVRDIDVLSTRGLLVPVHIVKHVGNFIPNRIRHYLSDFEFTIRVKNAGYELITSKNATVYLNSNTTGHHQDWSEKLSLPGMFTTLFSLKSSSNLKSWICFIHLSCPPQFRLHCYYKITIGKILEIIRSRL